MLYLSKYCYKKVWSFHIIALFLMLCFNIVTANSESADEAYKSILNKIGVNRGICVVLGDNELELSLNLARNSDLLIYVQLPEAEDAEKCRRIADEAGFYGTRIYIEKGSLENIHLASNLADVLVVTEEARDKVKWEGMRILRPEGIAVVGREQGIIAKLPPEGVDDWSHPYHGPDNNPQSRDKVIHAPYLTQFLAEPRYAPLPQVAVASAGRVFKAFGNVAFKEREEPYLNKLVAFNGYNGTILWERSLPEGMMVHRNTFIATPRILYVGDDTSCKLIDARTGKIRGEIVPPEELAGGTFWKWMALENTVLYALIGEQEFKDQSATHKMTGHGWPWDKISEGFNMPENPWGFGKTVFAIDPVTKVGLWNYKEDEAIDSRAMCMKNGKIYLFRHGSFLTCLDANFGKVIWRKTKENDPELFNLLGDLLEGQGWQNNWRTAAYVKCSDDALYFAGTSVDKLVAVSAKDGSILWDHPYGKFQLVLRDEGLYCVGGQGDRDEAKKFDPITGEVLADVKMGRRACTRPNGSADAIFYRANGGTVRYDIATEKETWIAPMRPNCHDGVTIANGLLYWWPSVCDCQNSIFGVTCLGPADNFKFNRDATESERLEVYAEDLENVESLGASSADWMTFRGNNQCNVKTEALAPSENELLWQTSSIPGVTMTAPVFAGGMVFCGGTDGIVRAFDANNGEIIWKAYTCGSINYPPSIWENRAYVGSGDGWVYSLEAKTGRLLWRFRAAPIDRKIPVYGSLLSTWPAASGVLIQDGVAYFAAGILNYDGTHVYALDARTGKIIWQNNNSGHLIPEAPTGISVHGHLLINDGKLYMPGGTTISPAIYDIKDGKLLNTEEEIESLRACSSIAPRGCELYQVGDQVVVSGKPMYAHPKYPVYDRTVTEKVLLASCNGLDIAWMNNQKLMCFSSLDKQALNDSISKDKAQGHIIPSWGKLKLKGEPVWEYECEGSNALAVCNNGVIVAGNKGITALNMKDGQVLWNKPLESAPISYGLAVNANGNIAVTLEDGRVLCFGQR